MNRKIKNKISRDKQTLLPNLKENDKCGDVSENTSNSNWQKDIETHDYYYDDSHGYKVYNPDEDDEENDGN